MSRHEGFHGAYNDLMRKRINAMDLSKIVSELQKDVYKLQQNSKKLMEIGLPLYAKDNERNDKFREIIREKLGKEYGDSTVDLWERWMNKIE